MTPGARVQAAIECLDEIFAGSPAEKTLTRWARRSRFAGSKDRAAVRDHVFDALRNRDSYALLGNALTGRAVMIAHAYLLDPNVDAIFNGVGHAPTPLSDDERARIVELSLTNTDDYMRDVWDMPNWCREKLERSHSQNAVNIAHALRLRAPVDLRVNLLKCTPLAVVELLYEEGILATPCDIAANALRVTEGARKVKNSKTYLDGLVELQDAGSQALVEALPLSDGMRILDYCAGGGGKSLAMAGRSRSTYFAHDVDVGRMKDIPNRAARAGVSITPLETTYLSSNAPFDLVLCDAPCSGSGAWRRSPDAKWRFGEEQFQQLLGIQQDILHQARALVFQGGYLAYATCSLFSEENEQQVNAFLKNEPEFKLISQTSWTPLDGCDGFHLSVMQLKAG